MLIGKRAVCPNNPTHKKFHASAHVVQDWVVDEHGNFTKTLNECDQVLHFPDSEDIWTCDECGAEVKFISE